MGPRALCRRAAEGLWRNEGEIRTEMGRAPSGGFREGSRPGRLSLEGRAGAGFSGRGRQPDRRTAAGEGQGVADFETRSGDRAADAEGAACPRSRHADAPAHLRTPGFAGALTRTAYASIGWKPSICLADARSVQTLTLANDDVTSSRS